MSDCLVLVELLRRVVGMALLPMNAILSGFWYQEQEKQGDKMRVPGSFGGRSATTTVKADRVTQCRDFEMRRERCGCFLVRKEGLQIDGRRYKAAVEEERENTMEQVRKRE